MKRPVPIVLSIGFVALAACGGPTSSSSTQTSAAPVTGDPIPTSSQPKREIADKYRTMYQIMPYSFADSNGDKIGDLGGIEAKLDYISDLNYTGIWMTPICPSPTYHKYDITDYLDIDPQFGSLSSFDSMVQKAHEKGMTVVFDLVFNHTSNHHPWFEEACQAHINGDTSSPYYDFYNIKQGSAGGAWHSVPGSSGLVYEGQFFSGMPDLNLQAVLDDGEGKLANELREIMRFWLIDHHVDGFRLDAVTSYFTGNQAKNTEFLTWLHNEAVKIKEDVYMVGEGSWSANSPENKAYQASGCDSFFNFANRSLEPSYSIPSVISGANAALLATNMTASWDTAASGIPANFIANHDIGRLVGSVGGRKDINKAKLGHSLLALMPGAIYNYYGDEYGQAVPINKLGDPDIRMHVEWGESSFVTNDPPGTITNYAKDTTYPYPNVAAQLNDPDSIVSHVRKVNLLRKQFPEIARGKSELLNSVKSADPRVTVAAISKKTTDSEIILVINPSTTAYVDYDFSALSGFAPKAEVSVIGNSTFTGTTLHLTPGAVVVLGR